MNNIILLIILILVNYNKKYYNKIYIYKFIILKINSAIQITIYYSLLNKLLVLI